MQQAIGGIGIDSGQTLSLLSVHVELASCCKNTHYTKSDSIGMLVFWLAMHVKDSDH